VLDLCYDASTALLATGLAFLGAGFCAGDDFLNRATFGSTFGHYNFLSDEVSGEVFWFVLESV
jgi:hypothetical protein